MRIKTFISTIVLSSLLIGADTFTTADPPMIYIYHFVSYDSTIFLLKDKTIKTDVILQSTSVSKTKLGSDDDGSIMMDPMNPKVVSAMVTSAVAKYKQMKIAGESIQSRISGENVMELVKSYAYPKETDYVLVGEINALSGGGSLGSSGDGDGGGIFAGAADAISGVAGGGIQYEIDLKVIDVSTQDIISSKSIQVTLSSLNTLRDLINVAVNDVMDDILRPFLSTIVIYADSTSVDKVRWTTLTMRPVQTMVGGKAVNTTDKDLELLETTSFFDLEIALPDSAYEQGGTAYEFMVLASGYDRQLTANFLQGEYIYRVYLKNYEHEDYYEDKIKVDALRGTAFRIKLIPPPPPPPLPPPPPPPPPAFGDLQINNLQKDIGFEVRGIVFNNLDLAVSGVSLNKIEHNIYHKGVSGKISNKNKTVYYEDLPLGEYVVYAYGLAEESFPGKHYVKVFSFADTISIESPGDVATVAIPAKTASTTREVIVYFDPFPPTKEEEYRLYFNDSNVPFSVVSVVGELHIIGISSSFTGNLRVVREGYETALIEVPKGNKVYLLAELNQPADEESTGVTSLKKGLGSIFK